MLRGGELRDARPARAEVALDGEDWAAFGEGLAGAEGEGLAGANGDGRAGCGGEDLDGRGGDALEGGGGEDLEGGDGARQWYPIWQTYLC